MGMSRLLRVSVWWASSLPSLDPRFDPRFALDESERVRCSRYRQPADRARFAVGRLLARGAISAELGCAPRDIHIALRCEVCGGDHGKPRVAGADAVALSIAHAHERVVVVVARDCEVGVDVERIGPIEELAERDTGVLHDEELAALEATAPPERAAAFLRYWTRKEALLKATGEGLTVPLDSLRVTSPDAAPAILDGPPSLPPDRVWMRDLDAGPRYKASLAVLLPCAESELRVDVAERHVTSDELAAWAVRA
jgi:4'-phosphopantetheinyl transferase